MAPTDDGPAYKARIKQDMDTAVSYTKRKAGKHRAEMALVERAFKYAPGVNRVLDAPCGVGRATILLARRGYDATGADLGEAAVAVAAGQVEQAGVDARIEQQDIERFTYGDGAFDATLCFRLYHHFPSDDVRDRVVAELCRVSNRYVLISYLSPFAYTSIKRWLRQALGGKKSRQYTTRLSDLAEKFSRHGYQLVRDIPQARFRHTLHIAVFARKS